MVELFDQVPLSLGIVEIDELDGELRYVRVNAMHAQVLGAASPAAVAGQMVATHSSREVQDGWRARCAEARASGERVRFEYAHSPLHPGFSLATVAYLGPSGPGKEYFGFSLTDITARHQLEEQLRSILDSSPGVITTVGLDLKVLRISGPSPGLKALVGTPILSWVDPEYAPVARAAYERALATGEVQHYEIKTIRFDGSSAGWFASAVGPLRQNGEIIGLTIISNDITERVNLAEQARAAAAGAEAAAAELGAKNAELEREVEERRRTEELLRSKQEEIRALSTPLLEVGEGVLAAPIIGVLDEERASDVMERLLRAIAGSRIRVAIIDLTGVEIVDSAAATHLLRIVQAVSLLGSRCVLSGIAPRIAQTMVALGVGLEGWRTFRTLKDALRSVLAGA